MMTDTDLTAKGVSAQGARTKVSGSKHTRSVG